MHTTRSTHLLRRMVGLAAVPALLLTAAACGDDDDSAGGGGGDGAEFCEQARTLDERFADVSDPTGDEFGAAIQAFTELDPPAAIAEDWETMVASLQAFEDIDFSDPEALDESNFADAEAASDRVTTYMEEECGISG